LGVSGQNTHEGAAFGGTEREPIELLEEEVGLSGPVSVGSSENCHSRQLQFPVFPSH
jgi:hypothetical protein